MSLQISQKELSAYVAEGNTIIMNYYRAYDIQYSLGISGYILRPVYRRYTGLPLTKRGRYIAINPESFDKIINSYKSDRII